MPRFHFHIHDGISLPDDEGQDFSSLKEARHAAIRSAGEIIKDESRKPSIEDDWRMEVTDERGLVLVRIDFSVMDSPVLTQRRTF